MPLRICARCSGSVDAKCWWKGAKEKVETCQRTKKERKRRERDDEGTVRGARCGKNNTQLLTHINGPSRDRWVKGLHGLSLDVLNSAPVHY